jgi:hypothetical protein
VQRNVHRIGTVIENNRRDERVCQYACEHTASCVTYSFHVGSIAPRYLLSSVTDADAASGWRSTLR